MAYMVSTLDFRSSGLGSSHSQGDCVVFLSKTFYSHCTSLDPCVIMVPANLMLEGNPAMNYHPIQGE